jgi:hypothetical protein
MERLDADLRRSVAVWKWFAFGVIALGSMVLVLGPVLPRFFKWLTSQSADWWGAWGQWVGGVGTAAATLIAATAFLRQQTDQRKAAAVAVSGWAMPTEASRLTRLTLLNAAPTPVFDVFARVVYEGRTIAMRLLDTLPPGQTELELTDSLPLRGCVADLMTERQGPKVDLLFRDAAGVVWHRKSNGEIELRPGLYQPSQEYIAALNERPDPPRRPGFLDEDVA